MKTTIYLVRHAEAQSNADPAHVGEARLTQEGNAQAKRLAEGLRNKNIGSIYTSEVLRALQTADEISKAVGKKPIGLNFLKERKGSYSQGLQFVPEEPFEDMKQRLAEAKQFLENLPEGRVVVVSHAIFIKALLAYLMLGEKADEEAISGIEDVLVIDNASVSKLVFNKSKEKWRILALNRPASF